MGTDADFWYPDGQSEGGLCRNPCSSNAGDYLPTLGASPPLVRYVVIMLGEQRRIYVNNLHRVAL